MKINWNDKEEIFKAFIETCDAIDKNLGIGFEKSCEIQKSLESLTSEFLANVSKEISHDKSFLIRLIKHSGRLYALVPDDLFCDKELLLAVIPCRGWMEYDQHSAHFDGPIKYAREANERNKEIFDDKEFILKAIEGDPNVYRYASDHLKHDADVLKLYGKSGDIRLSYLPKDVHIDREAVIKQLQRDGWDIEHVPTEYEHDLELLHAAITKNPHSFRHASDYFRKDEGVTLDVIKNYNVPLNEIDRDLWKSPKFALEISKMFGLEMLDEYYFNIDVFEGNVEFAKELVKINPSFYAALPEDLQKDSDVIQIKKSEEEKGLAERTKKTELEKQLDQRWNSFINNVFVKKNMDVREFQKLFFDTFWYFRNRKDVGVLNAGGWHILSSLSAFRNVPYDFAPSGCRVNEFNAARCLCEDLLNEIDGGMPGFYEDSCFVMLSGCTPPAGCSEISAEMKNLESFQSSYCEVVDEFDDGFTSWRTECYSKRYNMSETFKDN